MSNIIRSEMQNGIKIWKVSPDYPYNLAFTFATLDLKANWRQYRENFEKEMEK